jgi:hypothetical protein
MVGFRWVGCYDDEYENNIILVVKIYHINIEYIIY